MTENDFDPRLETIVNLRISLEAAESAIVENHRLRKEIAYWREKYTESLNQGIKHGEAMMGNMLQLLIAPKR